jgi:hypothetical protein
LRLAARDARQATSLLGAAVVGTEATGVMLAVGLATWTPVWGLGMIWFSAMAFRLGWFGLRHGVERRWLRAGWVVGSTFSGRWP